MSRKAEIRKNDYVFTEAKKLLKCAVIAIVLSFIIKGLIFEHVYVEGESMRETISAGETMIIYKLDYLLGMPKRGDIVLMELNDEVDYIKRVIGLPGEMVSVKNGYVYINGKKLDEPYLLQGTTSRLGKPLKVPDSCFFVMGDNRENSYDSRDIGPVSIKEIKGKEIFRIRPVKMFGIVY